MFSLSICHHHDHVTQAGLKLDINHTSLLQEKKDAEKKPEEAKKPAEAKPKKRGKSMSRERVDLNGRRLARMPDTGGVFCFQSGKTQAVD